MPLFAVIFGDILGVLSYEDRDKAMSETIWYAMWFVLLGVFAFLTQFIQVYLKLILKFVTNLNIVSRV